MTALRPALSWRAHQQRRAERPPLRPRVPLWWGGERIGSVEPEFVERLAPGPDLIARARDGWSVVGDDLTASLSLLANRMRDLGLAHAWRNEQLAVRNVAGALLGTIERAAVRPLGIATHAVHLAGVDEQGRHWVQQRSLTKPNDPGMLDTLVGGAIPARDSLQEALARETWEEAGLRLPQLRDLRHGGRVLTRRPSHLAHGYTVETLDWFTCTVPAGVVPVNQDGEVAEFRCLHADEVARRLGGDEFTIDATQVLLAAFSASS